MLIYRSVAVASKSGWQLNDNKTFRLWRASHIWTPAICRKQVNIYFAQIYPNLLFFIGIQHPYRTNTQLTHNPTDMSEMSMKPYSLQKTNKFSEQKNLEEKFFLMKWPLIWGTFVSFPVCKKAATLAMPPCCCWVINLDGEDRDILDGWSFSRGVGKQKHPRYHLDLRKLGWLWWKHLGCKLGLEKNI